MQAAMDEINAENEADGLPRLAMGIGVNTGSVVWATSAPRDGPSTAWWAPT